MAARTCPECDRTWSQRGARFCGVCGAVLCAPSGATSSGRRRTVAASRAVAVVGVVALLAASASLDLSRPPLDAGIHLSDAVGTARSPLSEDEVARLRERSDPGRLSCEPRGCESWRYARNGAPMASGTVELGDGSVLMLLGAVQRPFARLVDGEVVDLPHRLVALDPATGDERWRRSVAEYRSISGAYRWVRLLDGPDGGALIVSGTMVTAIGQDGGERWTAVAASAGGPVRDVWDAVTTDHVVLLSGTILNRASADHHLTAVDHRTGEVRWSANVGRVAVMDALHLIVLDRDGTVRGLDDATGRTSWERPGEAMEARRAGPWLAVQEDDAVHLVDPGNGDEIAALDGWLASDLVATEGGWIGTMKVTPPEEPGTARTQEGGQMRVVLVDDDGTLVWASALGRIRPWWDCCPIRTDTEAGVATVIDPVRQLDFDLATGRMLDARVTSEGTEESRNEGLSGDDVHHPRPDVEVVSTTDPYQVDIRTRDGEVTVRSDRPLRIESLEPLVVTDGHEVLGVRVPAVAGP